MREFALRFGSPETGWRWCLGSAGIDRAAGVSIGTYQETTALRDAEERFQRAFEDAGIGMAITGTDGRFVRVNRSLAAMLGYEPRQLAGVAVRDVTHAAHHENDARGDARARGRRADHLQHREALSAPRRRRGVGRAGRDGRAQCRRRAAVLPLADGRHRRAPRRRAGAGPERGALPDAGRRLAGRHLRHRRRRPAGLRQRAPARHLRSARRGPRRHPVAGARRRRRPRARVRGVPPRARPGPPRLAGRARRGRHRPLGAHPHGAGQRRRRPDDGPRRHGRGRHRRGHRTDGAHRARG